MINEKLRDAFIQHAVDIERIKEPARRILISRLMEFRQELRDYIVLNFGQIPGSDTKRFERMVNKINKITKTAFKDVEVTQTAFLNKLAQAEYLMNAKIINNVIGVELASAQWSKQQLIAITKDSLIEGALQSDWWNRVTLSSQNRIKDTLRQSILKGESIQETAELITGTRSIKPKVYNVVQEIKEIDGKITLKTIKKKLYGYTGGVLDIEQRHAEAIVRTGIQAVQNSAREKAFEENQDVLKGYQFSATLDTRTSQQCRGYDGLAWDFEGKPLNSHSISKPVIPVHWNCRSTWLPITKSFDELVGVKLKDNLENSVGRTEMDGQIASKTSYEKWLKKQPISKQKEILGKGKYKLYKKEKLTLKEMIDQKGNPLTLEELENKYN